MTKDEALQMCLEYIETDAHERKYVRHAIKAALEAKDEPVAWMNDSTPSGIFARHIEGAKNFGCTVPLYTTPPQRKPLTDEEVIDIGTQCQWYDGDCERFDSIGFARAIEAAHGIKGEA